ncbi:hypothetical protein ACQ7DA_11660 [Zafaria sp. J156]|uniref:hypothetical protein n=1 Tax=Zafaria sp. J156 TaxID=3116490 RepID=UPI002E77B8ED|nr:hypothetical protein [Zafaria sp. J156]MEE1621742.1 hypothetical protein [Zafaria sp. J156]
MLHRRRTAALMLAAALAGTLALTGCDMARDVFPKAFESEQAPASSAPTEKPAPSPEGEWKTVTTDAGDVSFRIRTDWRVQSAPAQQGSSTTGIPSYRVLDSGGRELAVLQQNPGGLTSQALPGSSFTAVDAVPATGVPLLVDAAKAQVLFDLTTHPNGDSDAVYGLTSGLPATAAAAPGARVPLGGGIQGYPKLAGPLVFQGVLDLGADARANRQEAALAAAREYALSQEYADITAMMLSLDYHPERAQAVECAGSSFIYEAVNVDCATVLDVYHTARIAEDFDSRSGSRVRVKGKYVCDLKELGARHDGLPPGYGIDGTCRVDGGYGSFTAVWKER